MNFDTFCEKAIAEARKLGCEIEICIMDGESTSVRVRDGEVISYKRVVGRGRRRARHNRYEGGLRGH